MAQVSSLNDGLANSVVNGETPEIAGRWTGVRDTDSGVPATSGELTPQM